MRTVGPDDERPFFGLEDPSVDATVLPMLLGTQLRRLREAVAITPEQAGFEIRGSRCKISRLETGTVRLKSRDANDLHPVGGPPATHAQLKHLLEVADCSHVTLQVVPVRQEPQET